MLSKLIQSYNLLSINDVSGACGGGAGGGGIICSAKWFTGPIIFRDLPTDGCGGAGGGGGGAGGGADFFCSANWFTGSIIFLDLLTDGCGGCGGGLIFSENVAASVAFWWWKDIWLIKIP